MRPTGDFSRPKYYEKTSETKLKSPTRTHRVTGADGWSAVFVEEDDPLASFPVGSCSIQSFQGKPHPIGAASRPFHHVYKATYDFLLEHAWRGIEVTLSLSHKLDLWDMFRKRQSFESCRLSAGTDPRVFIEQTCWASFRHSNAPFDPWYTYWPRDEIKTSLTLEGITHFVPDLNRDQYEARCGMHQAIHDFMRVKPRAQ